MNEDKVLKKVRRMADHSLNSTQYTRWKEESARWQDFYEGKQWTDEEKAALAQRGQPAIVTNLIAPKVDSLSGVDIQNRTQISFRPRTLDEQDVIVSEALTAVAQQVQQITELPFRQSQSFKHSLIYGIGWVELSGDNGRIEATNIHPYDMFWDVDDDTPLLEDSRYVGRQKWMSIDRAKETFPDKAAIIQERFDEEAEVQSNKSAVNFDSPNESRFFETKKDRVRIIEVQWKESKPKYFFFNESGKQNSTFNKQFAESNKLEGTTVEERVCDEVFSTVFLDDILLFHSPLIVQNGEFTYVPLPYKRRDSDKVFVGVVYAGIDAQEEYNKRRSKMLHLLNTQRLFVEGETEEDIETLAEKAALPNGVFVSKAGSSMRIDSNLELSQGQFQMLGTSAAEMQQAMGIFDELLGQSTNATSGVAVARRQQASVRTQSFALDMLSMHKRRVGKVLLKLIQAVMSQPTLVEITKSEGVQSIILNQFIETDDGKTSVINDVSTSEFDVVVEEQPDFNAAPQEVAQRLEQIVGNGQLEILLQFPTLLKQMGVRNVDQIVQEFQAAQQAAQQQAQAQAQQAQAQEQQPSPEQALLEQA